MYQLFTAEIVIGPTWVLTELKLPRATVLLQVMVLIALPLVPILGEAVAQVEQKLSSEWKVQIPATAVYILCPLGN